MDGRLARASLSALLILTASSASAAVDPAKLEGLKARSIGPAGMSGRIAAIDAFRGDPRVVFVGAASGGVWKSTNAGLTFEPVFDEQPVHSIGAVAVDPRTPDVVWVGTGEANIRNSISHGDGVYLTRDGGKTWANVGLAKTERIARILLHPRDERVAWACATGPAWSDGTERGVFRTTDGGKSWRKVLTVDAKTGCADLALDPGNPDHLLAAMWDFRRTPYIFRSGGEGSGLHATWDGGETWTKLGEKEGVPKGPLGRIGLAFCERHPEVVYAVVEAEKSALLRSENGGRRFEVVNEAPSVNPRPFYYADIRVDPDEPGRVYSLATELRVSTDGGKTFENLRGTGRQLVHVDHHALWIDPRDGGRMYLGNDGGMYESRDRGATFRFVGTLPIAQYYHVAVDGETPYNVYGGLQDNNSWRGPSDVWQRGGIRMHHWKPVGGGDGFETLPDPADPTRGWSLSQGGNLVRWNVTTGERRNVKPGPEVTRTERVDMKTGVREVVTPRTRAGTEFRFNWNAALAVDPFEPGTVYLGSQFVHRSKDRGETWETVSPDLTTNNAEWQKQETSGGITLDVTAAENYTTLVTIAPSPAAKGTLWTGSDDGRIHVTRDGGATWTSVEKALPGAPRNAHVAAIEPSRHDAATAFAVLDGHRWGDLAPYVYRTDDYGKSWKSLVTPNVKGYALSIVQDPRVKDLLFLGTETGLYVSLDGGKGWIHLRKTIPTASVMDLVIHPREGDLVIATHGRALYILDDLTPLREMTEGALAEPIHVFTPPPAQQHWRALQDGSGGPGAADYAGASRPYGALLTFSLNAPGLPPAGEEEPPAARRGGRSGRGSEGEEAPDPARPRVSIKVTDGSGKLVRVLDAPARQGVGRVAWDLGRDAWRRFPRASDEGPLPEWLSSGPEVPPGDYTVTLSYKDAKASAKVTVVADPRSKNTAADWAKRWEAIERSGALLEKAAEAAIRIRRTRDDVTAVEARLRRRNETLRDPAERKKANETPLAKEAAALKKALTAQENLLYAPPEEPGIVGPGRVASEVQTAAGSLTSSWEPPSPTHLARLRVAEARLASYLAELEAFYAKDVASFRENASKEGVGLLAP